MADLVGIQNAFKGSGWALLQRRAKACCAGLARAGLPDLPVLAVRDKGKLSPGQAVNWVIPATAWRSFIELYVSHDITTALLVSSKQ